MSPLGHSQKEEQCSGEGRWPLLGLSFREITLKGPTVSCLIRYWRFIYLREPDLFLSTPMLVGSDNYPDFLLKTEQWELFRSQNDRQRLKTEKSHHGRATRRWLQPRTTVHEGYQPDTTRSELGGRNMLTANTCHLGPLNKYHLLKDMERWSLGLWMPPGEESHHPVFRFLLFIEV